jgi:hypothetical protein
MRAKHLRTAAKRRRKALNHPTPKALKRKKYLRNKKMAGRARLQTKK